MGFCLMKRKQYYVIVVCLSLLFGSDLGAQQHSVNPRLSGRAVRSPLTPSLTSVGRAELNNQVINGVLKQNTPTKTGQRQISSIEKRLRLRLPMNTVLKHNKNGKAYKNGAWPGFWQNWVNHRGPAWWHNSPWSGKTHYLPPR